MYILNGEFNQKKAALCIRRSFTIFFYQLFIFIKTKISEILPTQFGTVSTEEGGGGAVPRSTHTQTQAIIVYININLLDFCFALHLLCRRAPPSSSSPHPLPSPHSKRYEIFYKNISCFLL